MSDDRTLRFQGLDSYIRCLAHILNIIVTEILSVLKQATPRAQTWHVTNSEMGKKSDYSLRCPECEF
ncbi:uncharacterized protein V1513DRAFT_454666 [Lipomyces chichibuensis]|uniref:uncharacterized protein n=1 Tax=Lipomyces chichibuensis TaxID=1546026 RepID=UPI003343ECC0